MLKDEVENKAKKKLSIEELQVDSFVSANPSGKKDLGGWTQDCFGDWGSFINYTCPDPNCDHHSIPADECAVTAPGVGGGTTGGGGGGW